MKKFLSLILAIIMVMAIAPMSAFAEETSSEIIAEATISFDTDKLIGKTKNEFAQVISVDAPGLEIDYDSISITRLSTGGFTETDKYEYSVNYSAQVKLYPKEGYKLSENRAELEEAVTVEGRKSIVENDTNTEKPVVSVRYAIPGVYNEHITVTFSFRPTGPVNVIDTIDISFDNEIDGKTPADYKEFVSLNTEGVEMGSEEFWATYGYPSWPSSRDVEAYENGGPYYSAVYIYPKEGYVFPATVNITVNGKKTSENDSVHVLERSYEPVNANSTQSCKYIKVLLEYEVAETVTELTFFEKIAQAISDFFQSIATFFTETFIQPIADLIMKF